MFATAVRFLAKKAKGKKANKLANLDISLEGQQWSGALQEIVKEKGPLTVASFWEHAQNTGISSKKHMKVILKWMRGQNHVKLVCNRIGDRRSPTGREFLYAYVVQRTERLAVQEGEVTRSVDGDSIPSSSDAPSPPAGATPHVEDQTASQI